jgi:hypothetical protein
LEALGLDPYAPQFPADEDRRLQVQAILKEYDVAIGNVIPVPPDWEGNPPLRAITNLADLAAWLNDQWTSIRQTEMGGEAYKADAQEQADRALRNGYRVLAWLGMDQRPERPFPAESLVVAKQQLDALERWVRQKVKEGWALPKPSQPDDAVVSHDKTTKQRKPIDDYEANSRLKQYLDRTTRPKSREAAKVVGIAHGRISGLVEWQLHMARRKAAKPPPKKHERQLTRKMLAAKDQKDGAAIKVMQDNAIWRWVLEMAQPHERAGLHLKTPEERAELVELSRERFHTAHTEPDD